MKMIQWFRYTLITLALSSCTLAMTPAGAPTNPPKIAKSDFTAQSIVGQFNEFGAPKMFLWPLEKQDTSGQWVPLSFAEKALVRQKISALADEAAAFGELKNSEIIKIDQKYSVLTELEDFYAERRCYALCDESNIFSCDVTDECNKYNSTWKTPQSPQEGQLIETCKNNEAERREIEAQKDQDYQMFVEPLRVKEAQASLALLQEVDRGYFRELTSFEFFYDPALEEARQVQVVLVYGGLEFHSHPSENSPQRKIRETHLDLKNGFLTLKIDAVNLDESNKVYGEIFFDLELTQKSQSLSISGDIRLSDYETGEEKVGRFSQSGKISPLGQVEKVCQ